MASTVQKQEQAPHASTGHRAVDGTRSRAFVVVRDISLWALAVALALVFRSNNVVMASAIVIVFALREAIWHQKGDIRLFALGLVFGCSIEVAGTAVGVWKYTDPSFLGIPLWLPAAWGITAVVLKHVGQALAGG